MTINEFIDGVCAFDRAFTASENSDFDGRLETYLDEDKVRKALLKVMAAYPPGKWIPVEEGTPAEDTFVLGYGEDFGEEPVHWRNGQFHVMTHVSYELNSWFPTDEVTHWMPFPEEP